MRGMAPVLGAVAAAASAAAVTGCAEEHVRDCGGGVEVVVAVPDLEALDHAGDTMWVILDVGGVEYRRDFPTTSLGGGETWFTLDLDNTEPVTLNVTVEIAYDGPGYYTGEVIWLRGANVLDVAPATTGCSPMRIELTTAIDSDGDRVPDAVDSCDGISNPTQEDADLDGLGDVCDGCPMAANPTQSDRDGDGRQDACDACPDLVIEPVGDEDGDAIPNDCDPCPHLPGDRADADSDGVGDACDPRPAIGGDHIVAFLDFSDASQLSQLKTVGPGDVSIDNGQLLIFATTNTAAILTRTLGLSGVVVTRVHQSANTTQYPWGAGTIAWVNPQLNRNDDPDGAVCLSHNSMAWASAWPTIIQPVLPTQHDSDVLARWSFVDEGSINPSTALGLCTTDQATATYDRQWSSGTIYAGFGLFAYDSVARFDYLVLIDSP